MREFKIMDDSFYNNGWRELDESEVMIMGNDGVWQVMDEEKKQQGIDAIQQSLTRNQNQSTTTENRNGNFNFTNT